MRHRILVCLALTVMIAPAAGAQTAAAPAPAGQAGLATELAKLNATLADIKVLLERAMETQGLDLLMKRMELSSAQVTETEKRLRNAESERGSVEYERTQMEANLRGYLAELERGSLDASEAQVDAFTAQYESEMARLAERLRDLDDEIATLANTLSAKRRELEDWQAHIDRRLGGV